MRDIIGYLSIFLIALFIIVYSSVSSWNGGRCECGGRWELFDIEASRDSLTEYYYKCESCANTIWMTIPMHNQK